MNKLIVLIVIAVTTLAAVANPGGKVDMCDAEARVAFSPDGNGLSNILEAIGNAQDAVRVQAYSFTQEDIAEALVSAYRRGVDVEVILDSGQITAPYSAIDDLGDIPVLIDAGVSIAHNKVMVIDDNIVITGSFNFSQSAQDRNAENVIVMKSEPFASMYLENYKWRKSESIQYDP